MVLKIKRKKKKKIVDIVAIPEEYNPYGKFKGELLGTLVIKDTDLKDKKTKQSVIRRIDTKEVCILHPLWFKISLAK